MELIGTKGRDITFRFDPTECFMLARACAAAAADREQTAETLLFEALAAAFQGAAMVACVAENHTEHRELTPAGVARVWDAGLFPGEPPAAE